MQPQTAQPVGSNPYVAKDGTQLDPTAATLTRAIRHVESGGNYQAGGDNGTSHGAYQFNGDNFKAWAKEQGQNPDDFSPENQDKVAYTRIKGLLDKGYTQSQVASIWNSGSPEFQGKKGYNKKIGVSYDVPAYVEKVKQAYGQHQQEAAQSGQTNTQPAGNIPSAEAATGTQPEQSFGQKALGFAGNVGDFFFPAVKDIYHDVKGDSQKSALQQVGDVGLSALSLIPGLGLGGKALQGAGLIAKGAEAAAAASKAAKGLSLATKVAKGATIGYGADVASHLAKGDTDVKKVLTPGFGTATGGLLEGGAAALNGTGKSIAGRMVNSLIKPLKKDFSYGKNPGRAVAEEGLVGNSLDDLAQNIGTRRQEIGTAIGKLGQSLPTAMRFNINASLSPLDSALETAARTNNAAVFNRLQQVRQALTEELGVGTNEQGLQGIISKGARNLTQATYSDAQALKQHIGDMTQWTGNPSDDKVVNAALQNVWRNISSTQKSGIESIPGIGGAMRKRLEALNQRYGDLTAAEIATKYREAIHGRQNLISFGDKLSGGVGLVGGLMTGGPVGAAVGSAALTGLNHLAGTSAVKTRVARTLAKTGGAQSLVKRPVITKGVLPGLLKVAATRAAAGQNQ